MLQSIPVVGPKITKKAINKSLGLLRLAAIKQIFFYNVLDQAHTKAANGLHISKLFFSRMRSLNCQRATCAA